MTTSALPAGASPRVRVAALLAVIGVTLATVAGNAVSPHKASLARLADIPLTVLGVAAIDFASFHYVHMIGWLMTGVSLVILEHLIADPDDPAGTRGRM